MTKSSELDLSVNPEPSASGSSVSRGSRSAARKAEAARAGRKNPLAVLFTMLAVGGMFAVIGLPAYAVNPVDSATTTDVSSLPAQSVVAASVGADTVVSARDGFTATTPEELAAEKLAAETLAAQQASAAALVSSYVYNDPGVRAAGDDYPFNGMGTGLSALRYYMGECTDFVAWRLNRDAGSTGAPWKWDWSNLTPGGGSANQWISAWNSHGWPVSGTPVAGAVAVTEYMHVAYVKEVRGDGTVLIEEYNFGNYHQYGQRVISAGSATYLYPPG
ncbi:MAG: CHAP domain-containing protein [Rhodoglobus sp.]|uniref:CHAP domain-containing protein n=1 Tax=Salinibacterium sp. G-O1 TaxID=3046208 RepID=UPI0024BA58CA|nr:CHAP domain-containing protein [Salinibacterium sp. G-O1]MDJ0336078.1 CHAP domain-containing protein [Salinibacterium sp. G-O1]